MTFIFFEKTTVSSDSHLKNGLVPMDVTESGIVIFLSIGHSRNAAIPIVVIELGIITFSIDLQPEKAWFPMVVTGNPSIWAGISIIPVALVSQSVMVTSPFSTL